MMEEVHKLNGTKSDRALSEPCGTVTLHTTIMNHCTVDSSDPLYITCTTHCIVFCHQQCCVYLSHCTNALNMYKTVCFRNAGIKKQPSKKRIVDLNTFISLKVWLSEHTLSVKQALTTGRLFVE